MATIPPSAPATSAGSIAKAPKSTQQAALEEALATVKAVAANGSGGTLLAQLRDQRAASAQDRLGKAQERYTLLRETMLKVLAAGGEPRSAVRLAREAASLAREVARAVKDITAAAKGGDAATLESRHAVLDGVHKVSRRLILGVRNIVDAARLVNDGGQGGVQQSRRARDIFKARRDTDEAQASTLRDLSSARLTGGRTVSIDA